MKNKDGIGFKVERGSCRVGAHFKRNDRGEQLNLCEPVYRICCKAVETKRANTTNMHLHPKHNHLMQFSQLQNKTTTDFGTSHRRSKNTGAFSRQTKYKQDSANGAHSQTV